MAGEENVSGIPAVSAYPLLVSNEPTRSALLAKAEENRTAAIFFYCDARMRKFTHKQQSGRGQPWREYRQQSNGTRFG